MIYYKMFFVVGIPHKLFWDKWKAIFQDDKHTRVFYLENQFNSLQLSNFSDVSTYCTKLKSLKDQLANLDQPISEQLVLRLVSNLNGTDFDVVATMLQQMEPLPSFEFARLRLLLEESRRAQDFVPQTSTFVAQGPPAVAATASTTPPSQQQQTNHRGGGGSGRGRGCWGGRGRHRSTQQQ